MVKPTLSAPTRFVLCILVLSTILLAPSILDAAENDKTITLRVMSFNIRYATPKDGPNEWKFRKELLAQTVHGFAPDLLGTQEVVAAQLDDLRAMLPEYTAVGVARDDGKNAGEWSAVFFRTERFEKLDAGDFWLSEAPDVIGSKGWDAVCVRICTWARLRERATGAEFVHANTHFDHEGERARLESAVLLRARLPQIASGAPAILTGDFNCGDTDRPYDVLTSKQHLKLALHDSYREIHPQRGKVEGTFHDFKGTTDGDRIDWILHTPDLKATSAEILRSARQPYPSDHFPVTAVLEMRVPPRP